MTDMVRIFNRREETRKTLDGVESAIETNHGVLVEYDSHHKHHQGYELVGFGR